MEDIKKMVLPLNEPRDPHIQNMQQRRNYSSSNLNRPAKEPNRLVTSTEYKRATSESILQHFNNRETTCGEMRSVDIGKVITLVGWLDSKKHGKFLQVISTFAIFIIILNQLSSDFLAERWAWLYSNHN